MQYYFKLHAIQLYSLNGITIWYNYKITEHPQRIPLNCSRNK